MEIDIPRNVSVMGCFSAFIFLYIGIVFALTGKYLRSFCMFALFTTTFLHWGNLKNGSIYQSVDITVAIITIGISIYTSLAYPRKFVYIYIASIIVGLLIYAFIKYVHYKYKYTNQIVNTHTCILHILTWHVILPFIYLWGFLHYELDKTRQPYLVHVTKLAFAGKLLS